MNDADDKRPNLVRLDAQLWGQDGPADPSSASADEKRAGFIFREDGDWFGSDRYIILWLLGKGGMCEVWLARDRHMDSDDPRSFVAIKVLQSKLEIDDKSRKRLKAEALAFMKIDEDPNLPRVYHADIEPERDLFYYVMEYLRGETLEARIRRTGPLPLAQAMHIVASVTEAVHVIHDLGIIHRDLKPENVFLTEDGRVVLLDLGVAKFDEERFPNRSTFRTDDASIAGTFAYMSPEQSLGEKLDARSDVYALGIIAYCCIAGRHPAQETPGGWMPNGYRAWSGWHINNQPKSLLLVVPGLPASVWTVVSKAIEKDRAVRFATAADLGIKFRALERMAKEIDLLAPPPQPRGAPSAEATTQPHAATLPAESPRVDAAALATTERTQQGTGGPLSSVEDSRSASIGAAHEVSFDPRSRAYHAPPGSRASTPFPRRSEALSNAPQTPNGTEIITPPRSSVAPASSRTASGTEIIPVPSRGSPPVATAAPAPPASPHLLRTAPDAADLAAPPEKPRERIQATSPNDDRAQQDIPRSMRSTPSTHALPIVSARSSEKHGSLPGRIALIGVGGLTVGLAFAALVAALVRPSGAHATAPANTPQTMHEAPAESPLPNAPASYAPSAAASSAPSAPVSVAPEVPSVAIPLGASTTTTTSSSASHRPPSALAVPGTTNPKPKSDRIVD